MELSPEESYLLGFIQTDGTFNGNAFYIELSENDSDIIYKICEIFSLEKLIRFRTRNTNFKQNYSSIILTIKEQNLVTKLKNFVPEGKKSTIISAPKNISYHKNDYWRGIIDGDGSLGIKKKTLDPFISLNTSSEQLFQDFKDFVKNNINLSININKNKRDFTYNIVLLMHNSYLITKLLYENSSISLNRKQNSANQIINFDFWSFNCCLNKHPFSKEESKIILNNSHQESLKLITGHHPTSISNRRQYLNTLKKNGII